MHNALFEFQELGFSHKQDLHISQIVGFFVLLVVNFSLSAKIFDSKSFMQISLLSGPFSETQNVDYSFVAEKNENELQGAREM